MRACARVCACASLCVCLRVYVCIHVVCVEFVTICNYMYCKERVSA